MHYLCSSLSASLHLAKHWCYSGSPEIQLCSLHPFGCYWTPCSVMRSTIWKLEQRQARMDRPHKIEPFN